jgi:hypothetical protein
MRWHFRKQMKWRDTLTMYVIALGSPLPKFPGPVKVNITRMIGYRKRDFDTDNLYASCKTLLDVMKSPRGRSRHGLSVFQDDNPKMCQLTVTQRKSENKRSEILVEVLDNSSSVANV